MNSNHPEAKQVRWRLQQREINRLSSRLKPLRSYREVAGILGVSVALVCQLETSALDKVARALTEFDSDVKPENCEGTKHE